MPAERSDDDLLRRARELGARAGELERELEREAESPYRRLTRRYAWLGRLDDRTRAIGAILGLVMGAIAVPLGWLGKWWRLAAFQPAEAAGGRPRFSLKRLGISLVLTLAAFAVLHVLLSALYFYATGFEETVYATGKQEIETGELYQFGGCTSLPCSTETDNGKFYLIESSLYFPTLLYPEENVFAEHSAAGCRVPCERLRRLLPEPALAL